VLLMGQANGVYWFGSRLSIAEARRGAPHNNATSLQVTAAVLGGMIWAIERPRQGIVEPEEMDFERVLQIARPYLGDVVGVYGDWSPLDGRERLFPEDLDRDDPWICTPGTKRSKSRTSPSPSRPLCSGRPT
jgi:homospermidine synthase